VQSQAAWMLPSLRVQVCACVYACARACLRVLWGLHAILSPFPQWMPIPGSEGGLVDLTVAGRYTATERREADIPWNSCSITLFFKVKYTFYNIWVQKATGNPECIPVGPRYHLETWVGISS
jgi:hypothetical protein